MPNTVNPIEVPTVVVSDLCGRTLNCFLEKTVKIKGCDYGLLTPVDIPVLLFRLHGDNEPELIETLDADEQILSVADVLLREYDLTLIRSAATFTVSGLPEEPGPDDCDEEGGADDDSEACELLMSFLVEDVEYALAIPVDAFFVFAKLAGNRANLVVGQEFQSLVPLIEAALEAEEAAQ